MQTPRDFVREPATWAPVQEPGQASFRELVDVLADSHQVPLVGAADAEMGPYSTCITVAEHEAEAWCTRGYRKLTPLEDDKSSTLPVDLDHATD
jgi:hypothetical protein